MKNFNYVIMYGIGAVFISIIFLLVNTLGDLTISDSLTHFNFSFMELYILTILIWIFFILTKIFIDGEKPTKS